MYWKKKVRKKINGFWVELQMFSWPVCRLYLYLTMDVFSCPSLWYLTLSVLWVSLLGIPKTLISIYHCDLSDYWQRIVVNWLCSDWSNVSSGVPQGTVLGTALFFLYINDLSSGISSEVRLFADDSFILTNMLPQWSPSLTAWIPPTGAVGC